MGVEESSCSCLLSVFAALRALLYDVRQITIALYSSEHNVLQSLHKIPFLHNDHATSINNIHIFISSSSFFCKQLNETTKVGTCFNWIATVLRCSAILSPSSFPTPDVTFPYTGTSKMWLDTPCRDWIVLQIGNNWGQLSTRAKLLYPKGHRGHYLHDHSSVSGRGIHCSVVSYGALKGLSSFRALQKILGQPQAKKTSAVWYSLTWLVLIKFLFSYVIRLMWTQHGSTSFSSSYDC